jgi:predicted RecB family nuclease
MRAGCLLIVRPALPVDVTGHRSGAPDALLRSPAPGPPRYAPVLVRWHKLLRHRRDGDDRDPVPDRPLLAELTDPHAAAEAPADQALRLDTRAADFLQLAHHHRLLQAVDRAAGPWGAVIGTDSLPAAPRLAWVRLDRPAVRSVDRRAPAGWRTASLLERSQHELSLRVAVADAARAAGPTSVVEPVVVDECRSCPWWERCRAELDPDDLSLRVARGRLDRIEVTSLRNLGVVTVADLAGTAVETLLPAYLPEVAHRPDAEARLRLVARRAGMLQRGEPIERDTAGRIEVPSADVEIDLDVETSAAGRIYLWGFAVDRGDGPAYVEFGRFGELDATEEEALAREALGWLRGQVEAGPSVLVYHYSGYEVAMVEALAARQRDDDLLGWAAAYARSAFVDLLQIVQAHFFGASGLGLKQIAVQAGFGWRDPQPGGLNSQRWFDEAVHAIDEPTRAAARRRVLAYNEDDVRATAHLRAWLRAQ